jgi:hypothetical protein
MSWLLPVRRADATKTVHGSKRRGVTRES